MDELEAVPEGNDPPEPPEPEPSFNEVLDRAASVLRSSGRTDEAEEFESEVGDVSDLNSETGKRLLHSIRTSRGFGSQVADQLTKAVEVEQERVAERQRQAEASDRAERKARLLAAREEAARPDAEKQRDAELLAEIERDAAEAAARAAGGQIQNDVDEKVEKRFDTIVEKMDNLRTLPFGEERDSEYEALRMLTAAPWALANEMTDPKKMAAERVDAWNAADPATRALAQKFGVTPPFDIDIDSDSYRQQLEDAKRKRAEDEAYIAEQTASGRSR